MALWAYPKRFVGLGRGSVWVRYGNGNRIGAGQLRNYLHGPGGCCCVVVSTPDGDNGR